MLDEMISHQERMFALVTDRMRAISDIQRAAAETRNTLIKGDVDLEKLAALDESLKQLQEMRIEIDAEKRSVETERANIKRIAGWVKPLENGYGYSEQFPKHCWDGFNAILNYLPVNDRQAIRTLVLTDEERSVDNFTSLVAAEVLHTIPNDLAHLISFMIIYTVYPKQSTPLHNRFIDDVFPKIRASLATIEEGYRKLIDVLFTKKLEAVKEMAGLSK